MVLQRANAGLRVAGPWTALRPACPTSGKEVNMKAVRTDTLEIAFEEHGPADGWPVILSHGFPYDVRAYDEVAPILASSGAHVIVPYLRGFGPTRFLSGSTMRSGQQAALGRDLIGLLDGLKIATAIVAGFDWGGLAL